MIKVGQVRLTESPDPTSQRL